MGDSADGTVRTRPPAWLAMAAFASTFDRFGVSPILVAIAVGMDASLSETVAVATGYFLAYGLCQPMWGMISDRFGRVPLMRWALCGAAVGGVVSALCTDLTALIVVRTVTGAFYGAIVPTSLTYVGDTVTAARRQRALAELMAVMAVGTAGATAVAGVLAQWWGWRIVFAVPALLALVCAWGLARTPEPDRDAVPGLWSALRRALTDRWVPVIGVLTLVEGALVLGVLTLLAPTLQAHGASAALAGSAIAAYGVGVVIATQAAAPLSTRISRPTMMVIGGAAAAAGYGLLTWEVALVTVMAAAALLGVSWAFLHTSLQTWATVVVPSARGTVVALFAASLFVGSALGSALAGALVEQERWSTLFGLAAVTAMLLTLACATAQHRFDAVRG